MNIDKSRWQRVKFGDVVRLNTDRRADPIAAGVERYVGLEHIDPEDLRIRRWGLVEDGTTFTNYFRPGQVLFGKRRAYQRKVAIASFEGVCSSDTYVLEPKGDQLLSELLPFLCQCESFYEHAVGTSAGSLSPRTNWDQLANYEFVLPPLDEQRQLAKLLSCSLESLEAISCAIESGRLLRTASIRSLTSAATGKAVTLGSVCRMQNGRAFPGSDYSDAADVRLLRPGNLGNTGYLAWRPENTVYLPAKYKQEAVDYTIGAGDILINLTAQSLEDGFMGRVCLAREDDYSLLNQRIGKFVFFSDELCPQYIFRVMQSQYFQQHCIAMCEGSKVKHLYWRHLENFRFQLPSLHEQKIVADELMSVDASLDSLIKRGKQQRTLHFALINEVVGASHG